MKLSQLTVGMSAFIQSVDLHESRRHRLMELGLGAGSVIRICSKTLTNDNLYLKLDNSSCMSISKDEASHIDIVSIDEKDSSPHQSKMSKLQDCIYPNCTIKK